MYELIGFGGTLFVAVVLGIICIVFITEKSFLSGVKKGSAYLYESAKEDAARMREYRESLREEYEDEEYDEYDEYEQTEEPAYEERVRQRRPKRVKNTEREKVQMKQKRSTAALFQPTAILQAPTPLPKTASFTTLTETATALPQYASVLNRLLLLWAGTK